MLTDKTELLLLYLGLLVTVCGLPFLLLLKLRFPAGRFAPALSSAALAAGGVALLLARGVPVWWSPVLLSVVLVLPLLPLGIGAVVSGLAALPMLAGMVWWAPSLELSPMRVAWFVALGSLAAWLPRLLPQTTGMPSAWALLGLALLGLTSVAFTGVFTTPTAFWALWHHWGAFTAPSEAMLAGAVPFRDFPVQYGMGPTLLIALLGREDPWQGTYFASALTQLLYLLAMGGCVLAVLRDAPQGRVLLALATMGSAVLLWTGYPPDFLGPLATPSVGGMRFLPLALLLLVILRHEAAGSAPGLFGHALWFLALLWSPEAGFHATLVWWPYLVLREAQQADSRLQVLRALLWGAARAVAALVLAIAVLALLFRLGFGDWPSLFGFLTYVRSPPGILQPNPVGPVWLMLAAILTGLVGLASGDARGMRTGFVCLAALVGVGSYYLGRSHDNNLLNLLPFLVLALVPLLRAGMPAAPGGFSCVVMAGLVAWSASFGLGAWRSAWERGEARRLGPAEMLDQMRLATPSSQALLDAWMAPLGVAAAPMSDAAAALDWLRSIEAGTPLVVNVAMISVRGVPGPAWTGMTNLATYGNIPLDMISHFIHRGAEGFRRPGWLLVDRGQAGPWLERFTGAYSVSEAHMFGGYTAYRLVPR
jgi:hypothetical protein